MSKPDSKHTLTSTSGTGARIGQWLLARGEIRFGLFSLWLLLLFAVILACLPFEHAVGERTGTAVTLFSWLPVELLQSRSFYFFVRIWLVVSAALWFFWIAMPWSGWSTVLSFAMIWSLRMENVTNGAHIFNATNTLLFIHAMWFHFYGRELKIARLAGKLWDVRLYPRWVFWLSVFYLGWFHSLAGFTKIASSGFGWGNGTSLQLWINLFGETGSPFAWPIMSNRTVASWMQSGALAIECLSILCILGRWPRYLVGMALIGFYTGVLGTFTMFGFHFNWVLVFWFLLPVDRWLNLDFVNSIEKPALAKGSAK